MDKKKIELYPMSDTAKDYYDRIILLFKDMHQDGDMSLNECKEITFKIISKSTEMINDTVCAFEDMENFTK